MIPLKDLQVYNMTPEGRWKTLELVRSPFYLSLKYGSREIYEDYYKILTNSQQFLSMPKKKQERELNYQDFIKLYKEIKQNGVHEDFRPTFDENNIIIDGQHRVAILYYIRYG